MAKMKIYDIAKSLNTKSSDIVTLLNNNGFDVKSHNSNIEDGAIAFLLKNYAPKKETKQIIEEQPEKEVKTKAAEPKKKEETINVATIDKKMDEKKEESLNMTEPTKKADEFVKNTNEVKTVTEQTQATEHKAVEEPKPVTQNRENSSNNNGGNRPYNNRDNNGGNRPYNNNRDNNGTQRQYNNNRDNNGAPRQYNNNNNGATRQYNNNGDRPYNNNNGAPRPYNNNNGDRPYNNNNGAPRPYNNNNNGDRPYNNNNGAPRPYNNNNGDRPYNNNNGAPRPYNNNNGAPRPYNNNNGAPRPYNNNNGAPRQYNNNNGDRPYNNNNGAPRQYNNNNGDRPYNNNNGAPRQYNNNNGDRPYNNNNGAPRPYNNNNGGSRPYNNNNGTGGDRPYNNNRPQGGQGQSGGQRYGAGGGFAKQRADFDKPAKPMEKTPQRKNDKTKKNVGYNKNSRYRDNDISEIAKKDPNRKGAFIKPQPVVVVQEPDDGIKTIVIPEIITIRDLADKMKLPVSNIVKKLFLQGKVYSINQEIAFEEAEEIALEYNYITELEEKVDVIEEILKEDEEDTEAMVKRPPVVCVMGHVDHGKTSLLDAIRETHVTEKEAGGITQHIGAYMVSAGGELITFLDTPGHEAFTSMRMRGAKSTDIAILVVAADDGVMPQTVEAINHAKAAEVEIIVAINKIDKPGANIERVKQELAEHELVAEDWGGSTVFVPVSAKTGEGIEQLLEMIILTSEVLELKANPDRLARGIVIEAQLDKGRGPVATILVQKGTLQVGDSIVIGSSYGKVRAMMDEKGRRLKEAKPSTPVEILGLNEVPDAGEVFMATDNDKEARSISEAYIKQGREKLLSDTKAKLSLDGLFSQIQAGNIKELNIIVKADVQGSVEAVKQSLVKLNNEEVAIRIIHGAVGAVNESDVTLASASNAIIIAFNVRPDPTAKETAEREHVDLRLYKVIYNAIEDIQAAMKGMLDPVFEEKIIGHAEIRQVFKASKFGNISGSYVLDGKIIRDCKVRITREGKLIFEGELASLKRFKDDVKEVATGYECGLVFEKFDAVQEEDKVEAYIMVEVPR